MELQEILNNFPEFFAENKVTIIVVAIGILIFAYFILNSGKGGGEERPGGMNPLQWEVFKRKKEGGE